jgi:hypothetical protein
LVPDLSIKYKISGYPRWRWLHDVLNRKNIYKTILKQFFPKGLRQNIKRKITESNLEKIVMDNDTYYNLVEEYKEDIHKLQNLLASDLSLWLN